MPSISKGNLYHLIKIIMKSFIFSGILLSFSIITLGQETELINKVDSAGKKHGKWTVYLNEHWAVVPDNSKATFYKYTYFDHGKNLYPMGPRLKSWRLEHADRNLKTEKPWLLDGDYIWRNRKGVIRMQDTFKNGKYVIYKMYYPSGKISQIFDYSKKWKSVDHSYCIMNIKGMEKLFTHICVQEMQDGLFMNVPKKIFNPS